MQEISVRFLGWEKSLEKEKATHSSILGLPWWLSCNVGDLGLIPGLGRSPREGNGYPLQYSGPENSMDGSQRVGHDWATFTSTLAYLAGKIER